MKLGLSFATALVVGAVTHRASADQPVIVEYVAPSECASVEAFQALLAAQVARTPNADRTWRFAVSIVHADDAYIGRLKTESGERQIQAQTCDEVASALALVIAMATPPAPPPPPPPPAPPPMARPIAPAIVRFAPVEPDRAQPAQPTHDSSTSVRFGVGFQDWANDASQNAAGPTLTASIEPRWGWYRMMFELNGGLQAMPVNGYTITWTMIDFESCPIDLALGSSNVNLIACNSLAFGIAGNPSNAPDPQPGAIFFGGDARARWQSPWKFFAELHAGALISTQSGPWTVSSGWWLNAGAQIGISL